MNTEQSCLLPRTLQAPRLAGRFVRPCPTAGHGAIAIHASIQGERACWPPGRQVLVQQVCQDSGTAATPDGRTTFWGRLADPRPREMTNRPLGQACAAA